MGARELEGVCLRAMDLTAAVLGGVITLPVLLVLAVAVRATSRGPALFRQVRVGRKERTFTCYKLRTMAVETPSGVSHEVSTAYVTPLGTVLRRLKLDELPQLWNVLVGEMSLVGPRPGLPGHAELISARRKRGVFDVRPGITGPSQVRDVDMSTPEALAECDQTYTQRPTIVDYLKFVLLTVLGKGQGDRIGGR